MMKEENVHTLPVARDHKLEGVITTGDIATSYMDVYDSKILAQQEHSIRILSIRSTVRL